MWKPVYDIFIEKKQDTNWYIDSNCSHVKLYVPMDKEWKLIGKDKIIRGQWDYKYFVL